MLSLRRTLTGCLLALVSLSSPGYVLAMPPTSKLEPLCLLIKGKSWV